MAGTGGTASTGGVASSTASEEGNNSDGVGIGGSTSSTASKEGASGDVMAGVDGASLVKGAALGNVGDDGGEESMWNIGWGTDTVDEELDDVDDEDRAERRV